MYCKYCGYYRFEEEDEKQYEKHYKVCRNAGKYLGTQVPSISKEEFQELTERMHQKEIADNIKKHFYIRYGILPPKGTE